MRAPSRTGRSVYSVFSRYDDVQPTAAELVDPAEPQILIGDKRLAALRAPADLCHVVQLDPEDAVDHPFSPPLFISLRRNYSVTINPIFRNVNTENTIFRIFVSITHL